MNEHQHSGENIGGRRDSPLASAGGNSPVLGSPILDSGRSALDRSGSQQFGDRHAPAMPKYRTEWRRGAMKRAASVSISTSMVAGYAARPIGKRTTTP